MPRGSLGDRMILVGVAEKGAFLQEHGEPALQLRPVALQVIGPQLVDSDHHDEPGFGGRRRPDPREQQEE